MGKFDRRVHRQRLGAAVMMQSKSPDQSGYEGGRDGRRDGGIHEKSPIGRGEMSPRLSEDSAAVHYRMMSAVQAATSCRTPRLEDFIKASWTPLRPHHHVPGEPRRPQGLGEARELAEQRTGLARVDDLLDPELLGRAE